MCDFQILDELWHTEIAVRIKGRAVVENYRAASRECRNEPVPHHPGGCCEVKHAVTGSDVAMQDVLFFVLDKCPGCRVDDAFRGTSCAAGVEYV